MIFRAWSQWSRITVGVNRYNGYPAIWQFSSIGADSKMQKKVKILFQYDCEYKPSMSIGSSSSSRRMEGGSPRWPGTWVASCWIAGTSTGWDTEIQEEVEFGSQNDFEYKPRCISRRSSDSFQISWRVSGCPRMSGTSVFSSSMAAGSTREESETQQNVEFGSQNDFEHKPSQLSMSKDSKSWDILVGSWMYPVSNMVICVVREKQKAHTPRVFLTTCECHVNSVMQSKDKTAFWGWLILSNLKKKKEQKPSRYGWFYVYLQLWEDHCSNKHGFVDCLQLFVSQAIPHNCWFTPACTVFGTLVAWAAQRTPNGCPSPPFVSHMVVKMPKSLTGRWGPPGPSKQVKNTTNSMEYQIGEGFWQRGGLGQVKRGPGFGRQLMPNLIRELQISIREFLICKKVPCARDWICPLFRVYLACWTRGLSNESLFVAYLHLLCPTQPVFNFGPMRVYFSGLLLLAEISLDRGVPPPLKIYPVCDTVFVCVDLPRGPLKIYPAPAVSHRGTKKTQQPPTFCATPMVKTPNWGPTMMVKISNWAC